MEKSIDIMFMKIQFDSYWNLTGKYHWNSKQNGFIDWLHNKWNSGLINITEYRWGIILMDDLIN